MKSIHKEIYQQFLDNPQCIFTRRDLVNLFNGENNFNISAESLTTILSRLYQKGSIIRTPTQLADGYYYSYKNEKLLLKIHENHLLPYYFENKAKLIKEIDRKNFTKIKKNRLLDFDDLINTTFFKRYGADLMFSKKSIETLALLVGFVMCDGCIHKHGKEVKFCFRGKRDAELFGRDIKNFFNHEEFKYSEKNNSSAYEAKVVRGAATARFLHSIGAPRGNKVFQPFLIPDWIYHGPNEVKKVFLSTVIGNEGSAPSNGKWRIQFVLSKCKEHVPNLLIFLNQIRAMLFHFGITTSHIQLRKQKGRQFHGRFYIKGKENLHKFYNEFSFLYASEKQEVLEELISKDKFSKA